MISTDISLTDWQCIYSNVLLGSKLVTSIPAIVNLQLVDINFDNIPEILASYPHNGADVFGMRNRKSIPLGFIMIEDMKLYKHNRTKELFWVNNHKDYYKFGYTSNTDIVTINNSKISSENIFSHNKDLRSGDFSYYANKNKIISKTEYYKQYKEFFETIEKVNIPIPSIEVENINVPNLNKWLSLFNPIK